MLRIHRHRPRINPDRLVPQIPLRHFFLQARPRVNQARQFIAGGRRGRLAYHRACRWHCCRRRGRCRCNCRRRRSRGRPPPAPQRRPQCLNVRQHVLKRNHRRRPRTPDQRRFQQRPPRQGKLHAVLGFRQHPHDTQRTRRVRLFSLPPQHLHLRIRQIGLQVLILHIQEHEQVAKMLHQFHHEPL